MRVLVTGWAGYVGPHVVNLLRKRGHYVIGLDTGWFLHNYYGPVVAPDEAYFMDLRDAWRRDFEVDAVVHLAGLSNYPMSDIDPELTTEINYLGTAQLIGTHDKARHVIARSCFWFTHSRNLIVGFPFFRSKPRGLQRPGHCVATLRGLLPARSEG